MRPSRIERFNELLEEDHRLTRKLIDSAARRQTARDGERVAFAINVITAILFIVGVLYTFGG